MLARDEDAAEIAARRGRLRGARARRRPAAAPGADPLAEADRPARRRRGVRPGARPPLRRAGAHDAAMRALLNGHVDAIASFDMAREQYLTDPAEREKIAFVAETAPIPEAGIAARDGLAPAAVAKVRAALLQMRGPAYASLLKRMYGIDGFEPAGDRDYDPVREAVELLGVRPR